VLRINEITAPIGADIEEIKRLTAKEIGCSLNDITDIEIARESIDSRKRNSIRMIYSVNIVLDGDEQKIAQRFPQNKVVVVEKYVYEMPENRRTSVLRPVVVGFGPAGMFAGLILATAGLAPIILERGNDVATRTQDVYSFWEGRKLNTQSNIQFGEGGAGTFSDGKLTTGIKDARCRKVLETFVEFGAPGQILYSSHPHIGTDKLVTVVKNIREKIIALGGEVRFGCCMKDIYFSNGFIQGISYEDSHGSVTDIETDTVILATGHSARDTVEMLYNNGIVMEQKSFSVGVRIEHPQEMINKALFGREWNNPLLGAANYKFANHGLHNRGAYTFCMCPGGTVVCAPSEENSVVTNGMSYYARDGRNANSALLVGLEPEYFESEHPLAGIEFQRKIERAAFTYGGCDYTAPAQLVGDFLNGRASTKGGFVKPTCPTGVSYGDIRRVLPSFVTDTIGAAIVNFDKKMNGFALPQAVLTAPESRSSSPVRIVRDEFRQSSVKGLFPCGEGGGYAGGIVSAAVDGIKCAESILIDEKNDF